MEPEAPRPRAARIAGAAALLAASVLLSRILGFGREMVIAPLLGATPEADAYRAAFQIPDLLFHFLAGGAFSIAFIPIYTRMLAREGEAAAGDLLAVVLGTMTCLVTVLTLLLWFWAEPLIALQFPRFEPEQKTLAVRLTRIVLPAQICFVAGGVIRAVLMARDRFLTQALAPLLYNLGIIAGGLLLGARLGAEGFAWGALAGAVVGQLGLAVVDVRVGGLRLRWRVAPLDRRFLGYLGVAAPLLLGLSLATVDEWYDRWFGGLQAAGTISYLAYARQLMLVPVAVVGQAIGTAALPTFAQLVSAGRPEELGRTVEATLRAALGLAVVAAAALAVLEEPLVAVVYERGRFIGDDTLAVARVVGVFAWAVPAWVTQQIAARSFYARGDTWRPMVLGTVVAVAAVPLYLALGPRFGAEGLAAAGALGMSANALATLWLGRRLHGAPRLLPLLDTFARAGLAAGAGVLAALAAEPLGRGGGSLGALAAGGAAFALAAGAAIFAFGDAATRGAIARAGARLVRRAR
jgi:putative peptidoglycan lipid II flippase